MIIERNFFVDAILPMCVVRGLTEEDIINYRRPFLKHEDREPAWIFPNEIPIEGRPEVVWEKAEEYTSWLLASYVPKLFFWVKPGSFVTEEDFVRLIRAMKNAKPIFLGLGRHFAQEIIPTLLDKKL
ncbi:Haloalkane dehalogenase [Trichoderma ghanense]|uniref:Haloalkane dehalogenase n=1 Tax=Trichoderma ghanense TaxID=65468 RepID=A0ABY2GVN4_9HYPO